MRRTTLLAMGALALVLVVAGVWMQQQREAATGLSLGTEPVLPGLAERLNDVARVELRSADGELVFERGDDGWIVPSRDGFPADFTAVKSMLVALSELERVEEKTARPDAYARLGVQDVDTPGASGTLVALADTGGASLGAVILGNTKFRRAGEPGVYVRVPDEAQSWLANGEVRADLGISNWVEREIVSIEASEVKRVEIEHDDGETLVVSKDSRGQTDFTVHDVPDGRELLSPRIANGLGTALSYLNLVDVEAAGERATDELTARFTTFDGLVLTVRAARTDEAGHLTFAAGVDEEILAAAEADDDPGTAAAPVRARAEELSARLGGWVFEVSKYKVENLDKRLEELLAPLAEDDEPEGAGTAEGAAGGQLPASLSLEEVLGASAPGADSDAAEADPAPAEGEDELSTSDGGGGN